MDTKLLKPFGVNPTCLAAFFFWYFETFITVS